MKKVMVFLGPHIEIGARIMVSIFLVLGLLISLMYASIYILHKYQLDYGEAPLVNQAQRLVNGENIYRRDLTTPPYIVTNYPPLYVLLLTPFTKLFPPSFLPGRLLSLTATVLSAYLLGCIVSNLTKNRWASRVAFGIFLTIPYVVEWSAHLRVDMVALAFSTGALYMGTQRQRTLKTITVTALLLVAAIFTRQSYGLAVPVTLFIWIFIADRRDAVVLAAISTALGLVLVLILNWITQGGFLFHIVSANVNPFSWAQVRDYWLRLREVIPILLVLTTAFCCFSGYKNRTWQLATPYLLTSACVALTVGKVGSNVNYLLEISAALALTTGFFLAWLQDSETQLHPQLMEKNLSLWLPIIRGAVMVAIAIQVGLFFRTTLSGPVENLKWRIKPLKQLEYLDWIVGTKPAPILVDEHMGMLVLQNRPLTIQPFEMTQLANAGLWDQTNFVNTIAQQQASLILIHQYLGYPVYTTRWTETMLKTISQSYIATTIAADTLIFEPYQAAQYGPLNPEQCPAAPWQLPTQSAMGMWWINRQLILMGMGEENTIAVKAVADGWLFRDNNWNDTVAVQHENPLEPGQYLWVYYSGMADAGNNVSYIKPEFPPGSQSVPVRKGQLLGYQGRWRNRDIWVHLGLTIVGPLEDSSAPPYQPEIWYFNGPAMTDALPNSGFIDPSPFLGTLRSQVMGELVWLPMRCQTSAQ